MRPDPSLDSFSRHALTMDCRPICESTPFNVAGACAGDAHDRLPTRAKPHGHSCAGYCFAFCPRYFSRPPSLRAPNSLVAEIYSARVRRRSSVATAVFEPSLHPLWILRQPPASTSSFATMANARRSESRFFHAHGPTMNLRQIRPSTAAGACAGHPHDRRPARDTHHTAARALVTASPAVDGIQAFTSSVGGQLVARRRCQASRAGSFRIACKLRTGRRPSCSDCCDDF
ncbi:hypothetical protein C8R46DRAFT_1108033 [Mycena filopes]|nr:hypothetical protein C8R46DRAFT_1108033 [Mycena filopes]